MYLSAGWQIPQTSFISRGPKWTVYHGQHFFSKLRQIVSYKYCTTTASRDKDYHICIEEPSLAAPANNGKK